MQLTRTFPVLRSVCVTGAGRARRGSWLPRRGQLYRQRLARKCPSSAWGGALQSASSFSANCISGQSAGHQQFTGEGEGLHALCLSTCSGPAI